MGVFASESFQEKAFGYVRENSLEEVTVFPGEQKGEDKWQYFKEADIFCFPSHYESESFGNVVVEAMMFELPVVATQWRGIPGLIAEGKTGVTVPVKSPAEVAEKLEQLILDDNMRRSFGSNGRERFLSLYELDSFILNLQTHFKSI